MCFFAFLPFPIPMIYISTMQQRGSSVHHHSTAMLLIILIYFRLKIHSICYELFSACFNLHIYTKIVHWDTLQHYMKLISRSIARYYHVFTYWVSYLIFLTITSCSNRVLFFSFLFFSITKLTEYISLCFRVFHLRRKGWLSRLAAFGCVWLNGVMTR